MMAIEGGRILLVITSQLQVRFVRVVAGRELDIDRATADGAVFDVALVPAASVVDPYADRLTAVGAGSDGFHGRAV